MEKLFGPDRRGQYQHRGLAGCRPRNPNDPAGALKVALLDIYGRKDVTALENFCARVIELVERRDAEEIRK